MKRKPLSPQYPRNPDEWRISIKHGIGLTPEKGESLYYSGNFPFDTLVNWICERFSEGKGYSPNFVPALVRNIKGLIGWVYGDSPEPSWPGHDKGE